MDRRIFLKTAAAIGAGAAASAALTRRVFAAEDAGGRPEETRQGDMIYRTLGRTGERVSAIGLGGHHIGIPKDEAEGIRLIQEAIDRGITFMDNCWDYHDGESETRMGKALAGGRRDKVFLMTKIDGRNKEAAMRQLEESLRRLKTDRIDLVQQHEVIRLEDPDMVFSEGGSMEALLEAKRAGKIRYIGFTGHKDPLVHLRMFETAAKHKVHMDTVQMPINALDAHFRSFEKEVAPVALKAGTAILGMKPLSSGDILKSGAATAPECLRYALSQPTSVVITGIQNRRDLEQALEAARAFKPMEEKEMAALLERTKEAAMGGEFERFKTTARFDGTAKHPEWLG